MEYLIHGRVIPVKGAPIGMRSVMLDTVTSINGHCCRPVCAPPKNQGASRSTPKDNTDISLCETGTKSVSLSTPPGWEIASIRSRIAACGAWQTRQSHAPRCSS